MTFSIELTGIQKNAVSFASINSANSINTIWNAFRVCSEITQLETDVFQLFPRHLIGFHWICGVNLIYNPVFQTIDGLVFGMIGSANNRISDWNRPIRPIIDYIEQFKTFPVAFI